MPSLCDSLDHGMRSWGSVRYRSLYPRLSNAVALRLNLYRRFATKTMPSLCDGVLSRGATEFDSHG